MWVLFDVDNIRGGASREASAMNDLARARRELAAVLRWSARLKYQQGVCNHFSVRAPPLRSAKASARHASWATVALFDAYAEKHLAAIMRVLDREEPEYAG